MNWKDILSRQKKIALIFLLIVVIGVIYFIILPDLLNISRGPTLNEERYSAADATCVQYDQINCENKEVEIGGEKFFCIYGFPTKGPIGPRCYVRQ